MPINGLRHPPDKGTAGWFIWAGGEIRNNIDDWDSVHIVHLIERFPIVLKYLVYRQVIDFKSMQKVMKMSGGINHC